MWKRFKDFEMKILTLVALQRDTQPGAARDRLAPKGALHGLP